MVLEFAKYLVSESLSTFNNCLQAWDIAPAVTDRPVVTPVYLISLVHGKG